MEGGGSIAHRFLSTAFIQRNGELHPLLCILPDTPLLLMQRVSFCQSCHSFSPRLPLALGLASDFDLTGVKQHPEAHVLAVLAKSQREEYAHIISKVAKMFGPGRTGFARNNLTR